MPKGGAMSESVSVPGKPLLAKHLKAFRTEIGASQEKMAQMLGVSQKTIKYQENPGHDDHQLPQQERERLWKYMLERGYDPWSGKFNQANATGGGRMIEVHNRNGQAAAPSHERIGENLEMSDSTYADFTNSMGASQDSFKELSKFFNTLASQKNEIDRVALINVSNPDRAPERSVMAASTHVNNGREIDDTFLLLAVSAVLGKEKDTEEKDKETSFPLRKGLFLSSRLYDAKHYKLVFVSASATELAFEASIQANYKDIGDRFRDVLNRLRIRL
jgi:hypothetical protein